MVLSRVDGLPLYEQLVRVFRERVASGEWASGAQLPSERDLCVQFSVSRITIRHAIDIACTEGLLRRVHGVGTFVAQAKVAQPLSEVRTFEKTIAQLGIVASTRVHAAEVVLSDLPTASVLGLRPTEPVMNLRLVGSGDADPVVFYDSYFPLEPGKEMVAAARAAEREKAAFSTLDLYRRDVAVRPDHSEQALEAIVAGHDLAELLGVAEGWPILQVTSVLSAGDRPIEYRRAAYRGDRYTFVVQRQLPAFR